MLRSFIVVVLFIICSTAAIGQWATFQDYLQLPGGPLLIGAGGATTQFDIQCNQGVGACSLGTGTVTIVVRDNAQGMHVWNPTEVCGNNNQIGCWDLLNGASSFASNDPALTSLQTGGAALQIAPSNTAHFWAIYNGHVYSGINIASGGQWVKCNVGPFTDTSNGAASGSLSSQLAIDPANEWQVTVSQGSTTSTGNSQVYYSDGTSNACGDSWTAIASGAGGIPAPQSSTNAINNGTPYVTLLAYDPRGASHGLYAFSYGNGVYRTTTGPSGTWSLLSSGPTTYAQTLRVASDGTVWTSDDFGTYASGGIAGGRWNSGAVGFPWCWNGSAWTKHTEINDASDAIPSPNNASLVYTLQFNGTYRLTTGGCAGTFGSAGGGTQTINAGDIPWLQVHARNDGMGGPGPASAIDPTTNILWGTTGIGVFTFSPALSGTPPAAATYTSASAKIEELVALHIIAGPGMVLPIVMAEDMCALIGSPTKYALARANPNNITSLDEGMGGDWFGSNSAIIDCENELAVSLASTQQMTTADGGNTWTPLSVPSSSNGGDFMGWITGTTLTVTSMLGGLVATQTDSVTFTGNPTNLYSGATGNILVNGNAVITARGTGTTGTGTYTVSCGGGACPNIGSSGSPVQMSTGQALVVGGNICALDSTHWLRMNAEGFVGRGNGIQFTTNGGTSFWSQPDSSIQTNFNNFVTSWMAFDELTDSNVLFCTSDKINAFYMYLGNDGSGADAVAKSTNNGLTWSRQCTNCNPNGTQSWGGPVAFQGKIKAAPNLAGYLVGSSNGGNISWNGSQGLNFFLHNLYLSTNSGVTWSNPSSNVNNVFAEGWGKAKAGNAACGGSDCPALFIGGQANDGTGLKWGFFRSDDFGAHWKNVTMPTSCWFVLGNVAPGFAGEVTDLTGDMNAFGTYYVTTHGQGSCYGTSN